MRWTIQPLIERPARALVALVIVVAFAWAAASFAGEVVWGFLAGLALGIALNRVFLPSRYSIEPGALVVDHPLRRRTIEWAKLERVAFDDSGALLSSASTRLSIDLPRDAATRECVINALRASLEEDCVVVDRRGGGSAPGRIAPLPPPHAPAQEARPSPAHEEPPKR